MCGEPYFDPLHLRYGPGFGRVKTVSYHAGAALPKRPHMRIISVLPCFESLQLILPLPTANGTAKGLNRLWMTELDGYLQRGQVFTILSIGCRTRIH